MKKERKEFLKTNDFATLAQNVGQLIWHYRLFVLLVIVGLVALFIATKVYESSQRQHRNDFNLALFEATQVLKKEDAYKQILSQYSSIPAVDLARLELVDILLEKGNDKEALQVLEEGLGQSKKVSILSTLLVLKKVSVLKTQKKYQEAYDILTNSQNFILETFLPKSEILKADLLLLLNQKDSAKKIYESLSVVLPAEIESKGQIQKNNALQSHVAAEAKQRLLFLQLNP